MQKVEEHQIGPRHYLPRSVRFLAFSDIDGGTSTRFADRWNDRGGAWGPDRYGRVYPVPWHGLVFDTGGTWRLAPWGFFDNDLARLGVPGENLSGFQQNWSGMLSAFGAQGDPGWSGADAGVIDYPGFQSADGYVLTDGYMLDAILLFRPDGRVEWEHDYRDRQAIHSDWASTRPWSSTHETGITGGFHLTLARDVDETDPIYTQGNFHEFAEREHALASISPFLRIYLHEHSGLTVIRRGMGELRPTSNVPLDWPSDGSDAGMGSRWAGVDPYCRVQQWQLLANPETSPPDDTHPSAYHLHETPYVRFKPAGQH